MAGKPNLLFIMSDQHRYDCIGYSHGYPVATPHLDRLAAEGTSFTHAFTPIPLCCPARQALLNGRRPESFGALWNYDISYPVQTLDPAQYSWPRALREAGYATGHVGKWHVHPEHGPAAYGFECSVSEKDYGKFRNTHHPGVRWENGILGERDPIPLRASSTHWYADQALQMMESFEQQGRSWHIRLDFPEPHLPCRPAGRFADMYRPEDIPMWGSFADTFAHKPYIQKQQLRNWDMEHYTWDDWAPIVARYYGIISQMDDAIGIVLSRMEELRLLDNTIVVYTSDHGDMCGGHRMLDKHYILYDDLVRVPLIVRWPTGDGVLGNAGVAGGGGVSDDEGAKVDGGARIPKSADVSHGGDAVAGVGEGRVCEEFVLNLLDLPPTLLEAAGVAIPDFFHGQSLVPLLRGETPDDWRTGVVSTYNGQQFGLYTQRMYRNRKWKYVWNHTDVDELYDLERDPNELVNVVDDDASKETLAELRLALYEELVSVGDPSFRTGSMKSQLLRGNKL